MAELTITPVPCLKDNYAYLLADRSGGYCAVVDPSEAAPVMAAVGARGLKLTYILNTHHHPDHVGGNLELREKTGAPVIAPAKDRARIPGITQGVEEGETIFIGNHSSRILEIPGHTTGHIAFFFEQAGVVFTGDTLFAMGCGRLFEGTLETMWGSLSKLAQLPPETKVYCGHEYTEANGRFALTVEPGNLALQARMKRVEATRARGETTMPSSIALERQTNPFLRAASPEIRRRLGLEQASDVDVFAEVRRRKDKF